MENDIYRLVSTYRVNIELKFTTNSIVALLDNEYETIVIRNGWYSNLLEQIEENCKDMRKRREEKENEVIERLKKFLDCNE